MSKRMVTYKPREEHVEQEPTLDEDVEDVVEAPLDDEE